MERLDVILGDLTKLKVEAIVNAANTTLLGGGGVDGAIHKTAGEEMLKECLLLNGCPTGHAKITKGYKLPAKFVIHAVGPVWHGGDSGEAELLASCYTASLLIASDKKLKHIAFPAISTGIYKYPKRQAAVIAVKTVNFFLLENKYPSRVSFVCFDEENFDIYKNLLNDN